MYGFTMLNVVCLGLGYVPRRNIRNGRCREVGDGIGVKVFVCLSDEWALSRVDKATAAFIAYSDFSIPRLHPYCYSRLFQTL